MTSCCSDLVNAGFRGTLSYCTLHLEATFDHYRDSLRKESQFLLYPFEQRGNQVRRGEEPIQGSMVCPGLSTPPGTACALQAGGGSRELAV